VALDEHADSPQSKVEAAINVVVQRIISASLIQSVNRDDSSDIIGRSRNDPENSIAGVMIPLYASISSNPPSIRLP